MKGILNFAKYFPRHIFELILSFSASAYVVAIFLIKDNVAIPIFPQSLEWISYFIYLAVPILIAFDSSSVKKPNRKRIALAKEALDAYDQDQKSAVLQSIRNYYPSIINDDDTFKIQTDEDLTFLLYGILQRYYTTADGREKRIASAVRKL